MISILLVLLSPLKAIADSCQTGPYSLLGVKIHGHVIKTISLPSKKQCEQKCSSQQGCNSISFHQNTRKCELHDGNHISHPESVLPSEGYIYVNFPASPPKRCSHKLCSEPLACVPKGESYKCVSCGEAKVPEQVLHFPRKSIEDHAILDEPFESLSAFTLSLWVQMNSTSDDHSVFSFASSSPVIDNAIGIEFTSTEVAIDINRSNNRFSGISLIDNKWHHISLTWQNTDGNAKFYIDGSLRETWVAKKGEVINKGSIVLGQEQDGYKTGYNSAQALQGNITSVNLWSRVFLPGEVSALATTCPTIEGDIVQWSALMTKAAGMAKLVCSTFCSESLPCVPTGKSYKCVSCGEAKIPEQVLHFPRKSIEDHAILDEPFESLSAFTLSLWVQMNSTSDDHSVFSFASSSPVIDNAIGIEFIPTEVAIDINRSNNRFSGISLIDNKWHHISLTWQNTDGNAKFYIDGSLRKTWVAKKGEVINKGSIVLGQEQDGYKTGYNSAQVLQGNITSVNLWSRVFLPGEVSALATTCSTIEGDIVQWSTLKTKAAGMAKLVCPTVCM